MQHIATFINRAIISTNNRYMTMSEYTIIQNTIFYLSTFDKPLATEAFKVGETGLSPRNTSKRAEATFVDSIVASTVEGNP